MLRIPRLAGIDEERTTFNLSIRSAFAGTTITGTVQDRFHTFRAGSIRLIQRLPQNAENCSNCCTPCFSAFRATQPLTEFAFPKPPLPSDFDGRNFFALGPETNSTRRNTEPFRYSGRGE